MHFTGGGVSSAEIFYSNGYGCNAGNSGCALHSGDFITFDPNDWQYGLPALLLDNDYDEVYLGSSDVFTIGLPQGGFAAVFASSIYLAPFLPQSGAPGVLNANYVDPSTTSAGVFGGDVATLKLNVDFADAAITTGTSKTAFGDLTLCNFSNLPAANGLTVREFLGVANSVLSAFYTPPFTAANTDPIVAGLNDSFRYEELSAYGLAHLANGPCP